MKLRIAALLPVFVPIVLLAAGCRSPYYADRGAALGGLTGAVAGAAIGDHNGEAAAGALIGGAVGALTGAAIGDSMDQEVARSQAIIQQRMGRQIVGAVTIPDVVAMTQAGLGDSVIVTHIHANGVGQRPQAGDLIYLKNQGVSEAVINAMQQTPPPQIISAPPPVQPVIVEEYYYGRPYPSPYWHHHHHHRRPGVRWGFTYHN
jgi:hypothetical protein